MTTTLDCSNMLHLQNLQSRQHAWYLALVSTSAVDIQAISTFFLITDVLVTINLDDVPSSHVGAVLHNTAIHEVPNAARWGRLARTMLDRLAVVVARKVLLANWDTLLIKCYTF
jgi:hypothetical protein